MAFSSLSSFQGFLLVLLAIPTDQAFGLVILESPARSAGLLTGVGIQHKLSNKISSWSKPKLPDHRTLLILRSNKQSALSSTTDADAAAAAVGESRVEDSPTTTASYASTSRWGTFDYLQHWYPVAWKVDMPLGRPTKLTVFDQDYAVVVKQDNDDVLAYIDQCPHRSAALSQGRLTSNGQYLQCTYHGWSFDKDGVCVQIPQSASSSSSNTGMYSSSRNCATAVPAMVHQGMVWLWPGPQPPKPDQVPPTVPEMDSPDFTVSRTVRDFPMIDWSLLLSNIMDPVRVVCRTALLLDGLNDSLSTLVRLTGMLRLFFVRTMACLHIKWGGLIGTRPVRTILCLSQKSSTTALVVVVVVVVVGL